MKNKQRRTVRIIALVLAVLMAGGAVVSAIFSFAYGEEAIATERNQCTLTMEYLQEEQALRMSQRLVYTNTSDLPLDRVIFYAPANLFRRQSSLPYEEAAMDAALPEGYLPGGIELEAVRVDGAVADWGFQGEAEAFLRVACNLEPGEKCTFEFEAFLLLTENAAFMGVSDDGWRLRDFYFSPASLDENGEFILNAPLSFTRYVDSPAMDVEASITLPDTFLLAGTGVENCEDLGNHQNRWTVRGENVRDFALAFGKRYREEGLTDTDSGVELRCLTNVRGAAEVVLFAAMRAVETCEEWFGPLPFRQLDFVQVDYAGKSLHNSGCIWLSKDLLRKGGTELEQAICSFVARQYFGYRAWTRPVSDAWLSDSICEYLGYLLLEEEDGHDAYLSALNERLVDSIQLTIPGGLNVASDAALFTEGEYDIVVRDRGAVVFHEMRTAMGRDALLDGLRLFYEKGLETDALTEMDLVHAFDEASGKSWESYLTDWVFNVGDYANQNITWLD